MSALHSYSQFQMKPAAEPAERRRSERRPFIMEARIQSPDTVWTDVTTINLSKHGVAFDTFEPFAHGAFLTVEIGLGESRLVSPVRVVNRRPCGKDIWTIGAEFC